MKLTTRSEYALLALVHLARNESVGYIPVEKIASRQGIPHKYLEQILLALKRSHYLRSSKGKGGGYKLAKAPAEICLAEIIRLLDGALAPTESVSRYFYERTPIAKERALTKILRDIRDFIALKLESTTLADVA